MNAFEKTLPDGCKEVFHIDAREKRTGVILTLWSLVLMVLPMVGFVAAALKKSTLPDLFGSSRMAAALFVYAVSSLMYIVLHELLHGAAYKILTREKLTFGISWSCAFCGVPNIYVSRRTALISLLTPFTVFSVLFLGGACAAYMFGDTLLFLTIGLLFSTHFGGCVGDLYMALLLLFRFKDQKLLMRDTGPEQFLYLPQ